MSDKDKYVNVADLKRKLRYWSKSRGASKQSVESLMETIGRIPYSVKAELETTLEAEPVRFGRWEVGGVCSKCGFTHDDFAVKWFSYCPNCGTRMDGES